MSTGPKVENRGGARPNTGPKPLTVSTKQLKEIHEAADRMAQEHGKTLWDICLAWIYDDELPQRDRMAAWKLYADKYAVDKSEGGEADRNALPAVYLPEMRPQLEAVKTDKDAA